MAQGLSGPMACEIFLDQELNWCPWTLNHWTTREVLFSNFKQCGWDGKLCSSFKRERFMGRDSWEGFSMEEVGA